MAKKCHCGKPALKNLDVCGYHMALRAQENLKGKNKPLKIVKGGKKKPPKEE